MPEPAATLINAPAITVSELSNALKRTLEDRFGFVRIRGEISGYRGPHASGHVYFALKDHAARIDAVIWKSTLLKMRVKPEEGLEVVAAGKLTTFPGKSSYQIIVESIEPAGVGALMALLETRKRKLAAEGLFDSARKRPLPFLPGTIGVITSPSGAVIRDILHRLADRFPVRVVVWPVRVQGETSADEISAAIAGFNSASGNAGIPRVDVLIVARGGGSLEDLWSFNEENVVRAAAASQIALISAVGHETDWTLIDYASDFRAPTPSAAAEICVPVRSQLTDRVVVAEGRLTEAFRRSFQRKQTELRSLSRWLQSVPVLSSGRRQRLDSIVDGLNLRLRSHHRAKVLALAEITRRQASHSPRTSLLRASERVRFAAMRVVTLSHAGTAGRLLSAGRLANDLRRDIVATAERRGDQFGRNADRWRTYANLARRAMAERGARLSWITTRLRTETEKMLHLRRREADNLAQMFQAVNHRSILRRGYALVRDKFGAPVSSATDASNLQQMRIEFHDGEVSVAPKRKAGAADRKKKKEPTLFTFSD